jgi:outer membrane protein TolC
MEKVFYLLILLSLSFSSPAQVTIMNDVSPEYLNKLIAIARDYYPKFKWTTAKVNAQKASLDKTKRGTLDFISVNYVYYPGNTLIYNGSGVTSALNGFQAGVFVNVGSMLQKPATVKQAKEEYVAAQLDKEVVDLGLDQEIKKRYYTYVQMVNILKIKTLSLSDAQDVLKNVKYKFEKGEVTFDIYNQSLLSFSSYSQDKITAEANLLIAKSSLEEMLGVPLESIK